MAQAELYVRLVQAAVEAIAADPQRGRSCTEIRRGYRRFPVGSYIIFYRQSGEQIDVVRILHQRMDYARHV